MFSALVLHHVDVIWLGNLLKVEVHSDGRLALLATVNLQGGASPATLQVKQLTVALVERASVYVCFFQNPNQGNCLTTLAQGVQLVPGIWKQACCMLYVRRMPASCDAAISSLSAEQLSAIFKDFVSACAAWERTFLLANSVAAGK